MNDLVNRLVSEHRLREMKREEGLRLLKAAQQAAQGKIPVLPSPERTATAEIALRLDEARRAQLRAQETVLETTRLVFMLMSMVADLQKRIATLQQRLSIAESPAHRVALTAQVAESEDRKAEAETRIHRARQKRAEAEEIRTAAETLAEVCRRELSMPRQQGSVPNVSPAGSAGADAAVLQGVAPVRPLFEYDHALENADEALDEQEARLGELRRKLAAFVDGGVNEGPLVRGEFVKAADNSLTSGDGMARPVQVTSDDDSEGGWSRGVAAVSALLLLVVSGVACDLYFNPDSMSRPAFYSGDRPEGSIDEGFYRWELPRGTKKTKTSDEWDITTTFLAGTGRRARGGGTVIIHAERVQGTLHYQADGCAGTVEWKISANNANLTEGFVSQQRPKQGANGTSSMTFTKFTLAARRTDAKECPVSLQLSDPLVSANSIGRG
ncbi:hypothetical protein [Streptomyces sp. VNUA24]|uniref:hypothetical protein n=1 Tax=Streptomyces sp. VNUA24 TaxID=3031131 RepID=UPI0023B82B63|nr:hypothetical protein [Streptomyces sp. VNUA24]WEH18516.1 hypothetical protein PYR72_34535 [Streptomyces sp. VNUA24]